MQSFSISHVFKAKSFSSNRTKYCGHQLDLEMKNLFSQYNKLQIYMLSRKYNLCNPLQHKAILEIKFKFVKDSPMFYLLPHLSSTGDLNNLSLRRKFCKKVILFSGKSNIINELDMLRNQIQDQVILLNIRMDKDIKIINTLRGGTFYNRNKFTFCLIPRKAALEFPDMHHVINNLQFLQTKKPRHHSNRGKKHNVFFENTSSNYVDLGIGVCRSMPGLYLRSVKGVKNYDIHAIQNYFKFIQIVVSEYLPKCLLDRFNEILNDINSYDLTKLQDYTSQKVVNDLALSIEGREMGSEFRNQNFMPSASFGSNNLLPLHTDEDMFLSIVHVHCIKDINKIDVKHSYHYSSDIVKYFTFDNGTSVGKCSGDLLIFNPSIPHCVSSYTDEYAKDTVYCVPHYFKSLVAGRNNNKISF